MLNQGVEPAAAGAPAAAAPGAAASAPAARRELSTQAHLVALAAAILLPLVLGAGLLLWRYAVAERARYHQQALELARQIALDVDRELDGTVLTLKALATSPALKAGDFAAFDAQAREVLSFRGRDVSMRDRTGQQLINTRLPWGAPLPVTGSAVVRAADARVFATGEPYVSDLYTGTVAKQPLVLVDVPVTREGAVAYALNLTLTPEHLSALLAARLPSPDWTASLVDRADRIVARSRRAEDFVGNFATVDYRRNAVGVAGVWVGTTVEDTPVLAAFARSQLSDWRAGVGVPVAAIEAPLRRLLLLLAGGTALAVALSALLAGWCGRRLARPVGMLAAAAAALGRGDPVVPLASPVREVNRVSDALAAASAGLRERARERDAAEAALRESEQRLRATQEHAGVGIGEVDAAGRFLRVNEALCAITGYARDELVAGRSFFDLTHPEDAALERERYAAQVGGRLDAYTFEKRYRRRDGALRWVAVSGSSVRDGAGRFLYGVRVIQDVHERKLAEARQRLLLDELNHRVKNTLAVVRSIAQQTVRDGRPAGENRRLLAERLRALATAHDLLTTTGWRSASLTSLVAAELGPYAGRAAGVGPELALAPKAALTLALVLHELATNAAKHGALSTPEGRVELAWSLDGAAGDDGAPGGGGERRLRLLWRETGGPPVQCPSRRGFGRVLIEQGWRHDLGGEVALDFAPEGLRCALSVPAAAALAGGA